MAPGRARGSVLLRQAETFFLGALLPLMGQLYVLAEAKGEIRLLALEAASGNVAWSQPLAVVEQSVLQDPLRRTAGVSPAYADGILVCPTSTGAIVGLDLATRSLLWGYRYGRGRTAERRMGGFGIFPFPRSDREGCANPRWTDASVCIRDGRIVATPIESETLHCLSLSDGGLLWKQPRQDDLYVACLTHDNVVLVGRHAVRALSLADGKPAWDGRTVPFPEDSMPSGRGFLSNNRYYIPLSSAEVLGIDVDAGGGRTSPSCGKGRCRKPYLLQGTNRFSGSGRPCRILPVGRGHGRSGPPSESRSRRRKFACPAR